MKKKLRVSLYLFIFTTLFLLVLVPCVYADYAEQSALNAITSSMKMLRKETEVKRSNGNPMGVTDRIFFTGDSVSNYFQDDDDEIIIGQRTYKLRMSYIDTNGNKHYIDGDVVKVDEDDSKIGGGFCFEAKSILSLDKTYSFELIDDNRNIVATVNGIKYNFEKDKDEETADGTSVLGAVANALVLDFRQMGKLLIETICRIITPAGDAFVDMISASIGEVATIDGAVYNRIKKVDIDFFSKEDGQYYNEDGTKKAGVSVPLRIIMGDVINTIYGMFRGLAIVVLLIMLVYIGIKIMITSTAEKKASYKSLFMAWVMGVAMLVFFPYVMKYTIQLNSALCTWIGGETTNTTSESNANGETTTYEGNPFIYGTNDFIDKILKPDENLSQNAMMYVRYYGANFYNVPLLIVYFIMIGQLLAILIMYYKRVFMLAFLISIFPLVAMIYPLNKIGDVRMNPFGTWFKEFVINVFVQSFHAATYKVIVSLGVNSYMQNGNWLFMIMCILFLFQGEKIIRAIFNAKSSMNSVGDMAMAGAMAMNIMKNAGGLIPDLGKGKKDKDDDEEMDAMKKAKSDRVLASSKKTPGAESNLAEARKASGGEGIAGSGSGGGELESAGGPFGGTPMDSSSEGSARSSETKLGRQEKEDTSTPFSTAESNIQTRRKEEGIGDTGSKVAKFTGTAFSAVSQVTGATMGMTYGLAQSDSQAAVAGLAAGASTGKKIGQAGKNLMENAVDKYADIQAAKLVADEYMTGEHDEEIGAAELAASDNELDRKRAQKLREIHARLAKRTAGFGSNEGAQLKYIKERLEIEENNK